MPTDDTLTKEDLQDELQKFQHEFRKGLNGDMKTYLGVLYEKFADDHKLLTQGVLEINTRLKKTETALAVVKDTVSTLNDKMDVVVEGVRQSEIKVTNLKGRNDK